MQQQIQGAPTKGGAWLDGRFVDVQFTNKRTGRPFVKKCQVVKFMHFNKKSYYRIQVPGLGHYNANLSQFKTIYPENESN